MRRCNTALRILVWAIFPLSKYFWGAMRPPRLYFKLPLLTLLALLALSASVSAQKGGKKGRKPADVADGKVAPKGGKVAMTPELKVQLTDLYIDAATKEAQEYYEDALAGYRMVLKLYPDHAAANYHVARLLHRASDHAQALTYAERAVKLEPDNVFYHQLVARLYLYLNQSEKAIKALEQARKRFPDDSELISDLGDHYLRARLYDKALGLYDTLMQRRGMDADLLRQKKEVFLYLNRKQEAIQTQLQLVDEFPTMREYRYELYELYMADDQHDAGDVLLQQLLKENPQDAFALFRLIERHQAQGRHAAADSLADIAFGLPDVDLEEKVNYLMRLDTQSGDSLQQQRIDRLADRLVRNYPDNPLLFTYMGDRLLRLGRLAEARGWIKQAARKEENNLSLWIKLLQVDAELNRMDSLMADAELATAIFPNNVDLMLYYAHAAYAQKAYDETIRTGKRLLLMTEGLRKAEVYLLLGDAYHYTKDYAKSDESFTKALEINPGSYSAMNNYAYFLSLRDERLPYAQELIEKALKAQPQNPYYMDTYGWVLYKLARYEDARDWIKRSYEIAPSTEVAEHLGDAYMKLGDKAKALEYWERARDAAHPNADLERKIREVQP